MVWIFNGERVFVFEGNNRICDINAVLAQILHHLSWVSLEIHQQIVCTICA